MLDVAVSPILALPVEILSEIFVHCLPTSHTNREWNTAHPSEAPMLLLHVCRIWREIAIDTSALWAKMEISMDHAHSDEMARAWLKRAKACPLSVKLHRWPRWDGDEEDTYDDTSSDEDGNGDSSPDGEDGQDTCSIFQTLLELAHNLKFLELSAIPSGYIRELDRLSGSCRFPLLQKLTIGINNGSYYWEYESMNDAPCVQLFRNAPLLRELSLIGAAPPRFLKSLPWHQLTKYTGTREKLYHCVDALRLSPNLVECAFAACLTDESFLDTAIHSSLKSLTLFKGCFDTDIFIFLTLPALETLEILDCPEEWFNDEGFQEFLMCSSPPLRQFTIRFDRGTGPGADTFLSMPSLVQLEIWNAHKTFIAVFFDYFFDDTFLPQLQHLSFFHPHCPSEDVTRGQLHEIQTGLAARWNARHHGFAQLKSFHFVWDREVDLSEDDLAPLREMLSEGLDITIKGATHSYI
ncbi:F-box domain-containing protein [Mycena sanguinolenta]|uniref:F-box domain-containing protein n=1 Tax=Mycena sanguinolenta TaxID=230812 RepID=A0A8H6XQA6_9AGAR|nr:F-box domain-containing protein [Mycena sanguinolenta]